MNISEILKTKPHNLHYLNRYVNFINFCKLHNQKNNIYKTNRKNKSHKFLENHHICPQAKDLFPEYGNLNKFSWNKITLTPRQHFISHWILWKTFGGSQTKAFMFFNLDSTCLDRPKIKSSKTYEKLRKECSRIASIENLGSDNPFFGKKHTEQSKQKMRGARPHIKPIRKHSIESKLKISIANKGKLLGDLNPSKRPEVREKLRGRKQSDYQKQRARESNLGKIVSAETRDKLSKSKKISILVTFLDGTTKFFDRREELGIFLGMSCSLGAKLCKPQFKNLFMKYKISTIQFIR